MNRIAHVADFYRRYPGETLTYFTRVEVGERLPDVVLRVYLPEGLRPEGYQGPSSRPGLAPEVEADGRGYVVVWRLGERLTPGARYEFQTQTVVATPGREWSPRSRAVLSSGERVLAAEGVTVVVEAKGRYLRYLPEIYEADDFMGRFLMLFESFWAPIEAQISSIAAYFDPDLTPARFLPWLGSWVGVTPDENLPEERQRRLLKAAVSLYRRRGTRDGLRDYLELYTGGEVRIVESRTRDFRLGPGARLGMGIALGRRNKPHTFAVFLRLPPGESAERWEGTVRRIIEREKPAHTRYELGLEK